MACTHIIGPGLRLVVTNWAFGTVSYQPLFVLWSDFHVSLFLSSLRTYSSSWYTTLSVIFPRGRLLDNLCWQFFPQFLCHNYFIICGFFTVTVKIAMPLSMSNVNNSARGILHRRWISLLVSLLGRVYLSLVDSCNLGPDISTLVYASQWIKLIFHYCTDHPISPQLYCTKFLPNQFGILRPHPQWSIVPSAICLA